MTNVSRYVQTASTPSVNIQVSGPSVGHMTMPNGMMSTMVLNNGCYPAAYYLNTFASPAIMRLNQAALAKQMVDINKANEEANGKGSAANIKPSEPSKQEVVTEKPKEVTVTAQAHQSNPVKQEVTIPKELVQALEKIAKNTSSDKPKMELTDHYVKNLYHMINVMGEKYYSSNHMLNIILNEKLSQAQADGIKVTAEIGDANFDDLEDMDITTVFANLLDNAIESANSVDNGWLQIKIDTVQDFRVIQIRNARAFAQEKRSDPAEDRARKQKEGFHMGLGLVNVRQALSKYHGSLEQSETENEYCINLIIPGKE